MTDEEKKKLGLTGQQPSRNQIVAPNTQAPAVPAAPAQPKPQPLATPTPEQPKPQPLAAPTPEQVQDNLPGLTVGRQTRGAGAVRLEQQQAPAGKELIGMRSGVPIYADATDVYSSQAEKLTPRAPVGSTPAMPSRALQITKPPTPSIEALREQYQKDATAARQEIEQKYKQPEQPKYFSKEYANQFMAAQEAANQRAKERIAYGGQPVRDTSNSMAFANKAAAAMRAEAARPKLASKEYIETSGLDKATQKRLLWGVGENGEGLDVTEDVVDNERDRRGFTKRPGPTFQNRFWETPKPIKKTFGKPGLQ